MIDVQEERRQLLAHMARFRRKYQKGEGMKIIEAMKQRQDIKRKCSDLRTKIRKYHADLDYETPTYQDQKKQVREWVQAHSDLVKEYMNLSVAITRTNLETEVTIELGGKQVTKTIAEWVLRRRELAAEELKAWQVMDDKGMKEGYMPTTAGEKKEVKIRRYYDAEERDREMDVLQGEPALIDARLEVVNAVTEIVL